MTDANPQIEDEASSEAAFADALTISTVVLVASGPVIVQMRKQQDEGGERWAAQDMLDQTLRETCEANIPWCQWLRSSLCNIDQEMRDKLSALADTVALSLMALYMVNNGSADITLTSTDELDRLSPDDVKDWLAERISPEALSQTEQVAQWLGELAQKH